MLVIALSAATALVALHSTRRQAEQSRAIDHRLAHLDRIRTETREIALSARRHLLTGDMKERQRAFAIAREMNETRAELAARTSLKKGLRLEVGLEEYMNALTTAMTRDYDDPIERLAIFEEELVRVRTPLALTFDEIMTEQRARRDRLRSAQTLAKGAQWAVAAASALGILLALMAAMTVVRRVSTRSDDPVGDASRKDLVAAAIELRAPVEGIIMETAQLRQRSPDRNEARALDRLSEHACHLKETLVALLDNAVERSSGPLRRTTFDAAVLVEETVKSYRVAAYNCGIRLRTEMQPAIFVVANRERIRQVLDSLLQLAIAAARSPAEVAVHGVPTHGVVRFVIIEAGPGTDSAPEDDAVLRACRRIVEAHGGRLGIQASSISRSYWFTLPGGTDPKAPR